MVPVAAVRSYVTGIGVLNDDNLKVDFGQRPTVSSAISFAEIGDEIVSFKHEDTRKNLSSLFEEQGDIDPNIDAVDVLKGIWEIYLQEILGVILSLVNLDSQIYFKLFEQKDMKIGVAIGGTVVDISEVLPNPLKICRNIQIEPEERTICIACALIHCIVANNDIGDDAIEFLKKAKRFVAKTLITLALAKAESVNLDIPDAWQKIVKIVKVLIDDGQYQWKENYYNDADVRYLLNFRQNF